jgi:hypothetical protein
MASNLISLPKKDSKYPWNPFSEEDKAREYWCARLGQYVTLTNNLDSNGIYYVRIAGAAPNSREYPVRGSEIIPAESRAAKKIEGEGDFFPINKCNWNQIKELLINNFIPSYPWQDTDGESFQEVRDKWLSIAKNPRNGLARLIEIERNHAGIFLDKPTFVSRMQTRDSAFPWDKLSEFLNFDVPIT